MSSGVRRQERAVGTRRNRRILVVAGETVAGDALRELIRRRARRYDDEVFVVCPAVTSRFRRWLLDDDRARAEAHSRLDASLAALARVGILADGWVVDANPLRAIKDALRTFAADELIISTRPARRWHRLRRDVVESARDRYLLPIAHVVVDLERPYDSASDNNPRMTT